MSEHAEKTENRKRDR